MRILQVSFIISLLAGTVPYSTAISLRPRIVPYSAVSYEELRSNFKSNLYLRQRGLMEYERYDAFIEPYMQEAEETLAVSRFLMENPCHHLSSSYLACLLSYNVAYFNSHAISQSYLLKISRRVQKNCRDALQMAYDNLLQVIKDIRDTASTKDLNPDEEMQRTVGLIAKVNANYYRKLGIGCRLGFPWVVLVSRWS